MIALMKDLNDDNFMIYAIKNYNTTNGFMSELEEELKRIKYVKRLIKKYKLVGELKERLILNHIIILANIFGVRPTVRMLFAKIEPEHHQILKTFLMFLNYLPTTIEGVNGTDIDITRLKIDVFVAKRLRNI